MKPEEKARQQIDLMLEAAGWNVQDYRDINLGASFGVAVREFPVGAGFADYLLFIDRKAVGVVEAKHEGVTLSGVSEQTQAYRTSMPAAVPTLFRPLPFAYESSGVETFFRSEQDPEPRSRRVFGFHRPETLRSWAKEESPLRRRLQQMPPLIVRGLRDCQVEAITNLEVSFAGDHPRSLIQMATGSGKTFTSVSFAYRLIKHAHARRVLFLVDRSNLGRQTLKEFQQYVTPDDGRKFTDLYNVQHLTKNTIDPVSRVCITTIQRLFSMFKGDEVFEEENEEQSLFDMPGDQQPIPISYNSKIPIEMFDFVITDECHRSIYNLWRQVLEYFDASLVGLTATPSKQTIGFFHNNLVMEYSHERAVADGVNVGYEVYRIKTRITDEGSEIEKGFWVGKRDKLSRKERWEMLDEDFTYTPTQIDRAVVVPDQIRTVIRTFRDALFTEIFPGRTEVPKTLIFAKDDAHAEEIVHIIREEFGKGNEFCKKITYRTTGEKPENLIKSFCNSYHPRIAVTVDMIATGTDIKPLECVMFMRDVRSRTYFDQMKGRGTRTISDTDLQSVTPDAEHKTHFILIDAVGVCESPKLEVRPLERKRTVSFEKLLQQVATGIRDDDTLTSLAGRIARIDREMTSPDRADLEKVTKVPIRRIINRLMDATDPDVQDQKAREIFAVDSPTSRQVTEATEVLTTEACRPFDDPAIRRMLEDIRRKNEQVIDRVSIDEVVFSGFDIHAKEKAQAVVSTFTTFIETNKDELEALRILYSQPYGRRHLTYEAIKELANRIEQPPYLLSTDILWKAYAQLEASKVHGAGPQKLLTNIVSLLRFAIGEEPVLEPFDTHVHDEFKRWVSEQEGTGKKFTPEECRWLVMIRDHIAASLSIDMEDLDNHPFSDRGGRMKAWEVFGERLEPLMLELSEVLAG
ncbi:type I restriction-modification enzyme R subunit C-terminal domain-containing protein [uncultured Methanospirillum sp.]|uniref:type I restriction endonuclease subunit R n=1 Tax=uncultured Methanospirillum sp. TaxID=262503 RepID=UPI0029C8BB40|nr:type I restriction-modification enzyme R subunit C-terminal domain-containing protein [uncultured Methanospirillum sp.]